MIRHFRLFPCFQFNVIQAFPSQEGKGMLSGNDLAAKCEECSSFLSLLHGHSGQSIHSPNCRLCPSIEQKCPVRTALGCLPLCPHLPCSGLTQPLLITPAHDSTKAGRTQPKHHRDFTFPSPALRKGPCLQEVPPVRWP